MPHTPYKLARRMDKSLIDRIAARDWFYEFDLPDGVVAPCRTPEHVRPIHSTRLDMLSAAIEPYVAERGGWGEISAIDVACHQGFYSAHLARRGARDVLGIDARTDHIADADLIRQAYGLHNLRFAKHDVYEVKAPQLGGFDVVVCYGLLYHVENPIGVLRLCRELIGPAGGVCVVETQVVPNMSGVVDWGSYEYVQPLQGVFGLIDETHETHVPEASTTGLCLAPSLEGLIWVMRKLGYKQVVQIPAPANAYEQHRFNKRVVVAGYV